MKTVNVLRLTLISILLISSALSITASSSMPLAGTTECASITTDGTQGNGDSGWAEWEDYYQQKISADGRYVAFMSIATNLVANDTNGVADIFVHDRQTGETTRVSVASDGTQGNGKSVVPYISADGTYVAFESYADNLVAGDTNDEIDIFLHNRETGQTTRVSVSSDEVQGNGWSYYPSISADGRYVSFSSFSNNLVDGDANGFNDIFVRDTLLGVTILASVATDGTQANLWSGLSTISADGHLVAFNSAASNLVEGDTNGIMDVFVRDLLAGETVRVSVASDGTQANGTLNIDDAPFISGNNHFVVFSSDATNLVDADTNGQIDIFVHNLETGETQRVSLTNDGSEANGSSWDASISGDGRYVVFVSQASNLVIGVPHSWMNVYIRDRFFNRTMRADLTYTGAATSSLTQVASISATGRYVSFVSYGGDFVPGHTNSFNDVFVRDRGALPTTFLPLITR